MLKMQFDEDELWIELIISEMAPGITTLAFGKIKAFGTCVKFYTHHIN